MPKTKLTPVMQRYVDAVSAGRAQARRGQHPLGARRIIVKTDAFHKTTVVDQQGRREKLVPIFRSIANPRREGKRYEHDE